MAAYLSTDVAGGPSMGGFQANVFRGAKVSRFHEHDFCFAV